MANSLKEIVASALTDIAFARAEADQQSAQLSEKYRNDPILQYFPVPRVEINELVIDLKFAIEKTDSNRKTLSVITESKTLSELPPQTVSTVRIATQMKNYLWTQTDFEKGNEKKLVEI